MVYLIYVFNFSTQAYPGRTTLMHELATLTFSCLLPDIHRAKTELVNRSILAPQYVLAFSAGASSTQPHRRS